MVVLPTDFAEDPKRLIPAWRQRFAEFGKSQAKAGKAFAIFHCTFSIFHYSSRTALFRRSAHKWEMENEQWKMPSTHSHAGG